MTWADGLEAEALRFAQLDHSPIRNLAGPGTGKSFGLRRRVARLLEEEVVAPEEILVLTFARTAAEDLIGALRGLGEPGVDSIAVRTLHSFCFSMLSREGVLQATGRQPRIVLEFERDLLLGDLQGSYGGLRDRRAMASAFDAAWARLQSDEPGQPIEGLDQRFQDELLALLRWHRAMLIGEVVPISLSYLRNNPEAAERRAYKQVLVDEYQDLNKAEQTLIEMLCDDASFVVVGDDDQSIYGFKWANPEGIRDFSDTHPGTAEIEFVECRRCPQAVVRMAATIIERNPGRAHVPLAPRPANPEGEVHHIQWTSLEAEAEGIADFIKAQVDGGVTPGMCLVLAPSRMIGYAIRDAIAQRDVAVRSFFREEALATEEAREALTLLRLLVSPGDRVALRAWLSFGSTTARKGPYRRLYEQAVFHGGDVAEVLRLIEAGDLAVPYSADCLARWRHLQERREELLPLLEDAAALRDLLFPEDDGALAELRLAAIAAIEADPDISSVALADAVTYAITQPEVPLEVPYARVMSFHKSKGLTAEVVVLAGLVEGLMPRQGPGSFGTADENLEEQRRLFYVGLTRTTRVVVFSSYSELSDTVVYRLQVAYGRRRGRLFRTVASRFLEEVGEDLPEALRGNEWRY